MKQTDVANIRGDIASLRQLTVEFVTATAAAFARVDKRFNSLEARADATNAKVDALDAKIDALDTTVNSKIDALSASVAEALIKINDMSDERWSNHERRICRLEKRTC